MVSRQNDDRLIAAIDRIFTPKGHGFDTIDVMCAAHQDAELDAAIRGVVTRWAHKEDIHSHFLRPQLKRIAKERGWGTMPDGRWTLRRLQKNRRGIGYHTK